MTTIMVMVTHFCVLHFHNICLYDGVSPIIPCHSKIEFFFQIS